MNVDKEKANITKKTILPKCDAGHELSQLTESPYEKYEGGRIGCNGCGSDKVVSSQTPCYSCRSCGADYCTDCYKKLTKTVDVVGDAIPVADAAEAVYTEMDKKDLTNYIVVKIQKVES